MKYLYALIISVIVLAGCKKEKRNLDSQITWKKYYRLNKITCDTIFTFYIPNGFTPNGDFSNEIWGPKWNYLDSSKYHIDIFTKEGKMVLSSDNPMANFDGKKSSNKYYSSQTFGYSIRAADLSGNNYSFKGTFVLLK